jgi:hypothetical protein
MTLRVHAVPGQEHTLSVAPARRGRTQVRISAQTHVGRHRQAGAEIRLRVSLRTWLQALREVIEGRAPAPGGEILADVHAACMTGLTAEEWQSITAAALIDAYPDVVWNAVHSPDTARIIGPAPAGYSGYVPGTPIGEAGEMQYFVSRDATGLLQGSAAAVTEYAGRRRAVTHTIGPPGIEIVYLLTAIAGQTQLELTYRWPAVRPDSETHRALADFAQATVDGTRQSSRIRPQVKQ